MIFLELISVCKSVILFPIFIRGPFHKSASDSRDHLLVDYKADDADKTHVTTKHVTKRAGDSVMNVRGYYQRT